MENNYISIQTSFDLVDLILTARKRIIYSSINIQSEFSGILAEASMNGIRVKVILNPAEDSFRNGYGDIGAMKILQESNVEIFEIAGNQIGFIIIDDTGYFLFPESRVFLAEPEGPNAVLMDEITILRVINHYFPPENESEKALVAEEVKRIIVGYEQDKETIIANVSDSNGIIKPAPLNLENLDQIREKLRNDPPIHPDIHRKISTYSAKIQFVEMKFEGANIASKSLSIPRDLLPVNNAELRKRLETNIKIFDNIDSNQDLQKLLDIKSLVEKLRVHQHDDKKEGYLIPIKCREKSVIKKDRKNDFLIEYDKIKKSIDVISKKASEAIDLDIIKTKRALKNELIEFYKINPPEDYVGYLFSSLSEVIEDYVNKKIERVKFPTAKDLLSKMVLSCRFYDLTVEDFGDTQLLDEFREKDILPEKDINAIVSFQPAFGVSK